MPPRGNSTTYAIIEQFAENVNSKKADNFSYKHKEMTLKQVFIQNLKEFHKKEGLSPAA